MVLRWHSHFGTQLQLRVLWRVTPVEHMWWISASFSFACIIILVYCCSIWLHKTLQNKQNSLCCSSSQACFFLLREISSKVNYWVILMWQVVGSHCTFFFFFCLDGASIFLCCHLTDVTDETLEKCFSISIVPSEKKRNWKTIKVLF